MTEDASAPGEAPKPANLRTVGSNGAVVHLQADVNSPVLVTLNAGDEVLLQGFVLDSAGAAWFVTQGGRASAGQFTDDSVEGLTDLTANSVPAGPPSIDGAQQNPIMLDQATIDAIVEGVVRRLQPTAG